MDVHDWFLVLPRCSVFNDLSNAKVSSIYSNFILQFYLFCDFPIFFVFVSFWFILFVVFILEKNILKCTFFSLQLLLVVMFLLLFS